MSHYPIKCGRCLQTIYLFEAEQGDTHEEVEECIHALALLIDEKVVS